MGIHTRIPLSIPIADPTADANYIIARVPSGAGKMTLTGASVVLDGAVASSGTDGVSVKLQKTGADGSETAADITTATGGINVAWTAERAKALAVVTDDGANVLDEGEHIKLVYDETGTVAPGLLTVFLELAPGVA